jgi:hypothetical protein
MIIILLRGFSCAGKDYIGKILSDKYNYYRFAFADSLKQIVGDKYGCDISLLQTQEGKKQICNNDAKLRTYRQILIDEALELRSKDPDIFARKCCNDILLSGHKQIIITDWRYMNEYDIINMTFSGHNIIRIHVICVDQLTSPIDDISEYQLQNITNDYKIYNTMDEKVLVHIDNLINQIKLKCNKIEQLEPNGVTTE